MEDENFIGNYMCGCYGLNFRNNVYKSEGTILMENVYDLSETIARIMVICGIHELKVVEAIDIISFALVHCDKIKLRTNTIPRKRLRKNELLYELASKCYMNRVEAKFTYAIIKHAFKTFYQEAIDPFEKTQLLKYQRGIWVRTAKRTAEIFSKYEDKFLSAKKDYKELIKNVYHKLYDRIQERCNPLKAKQRAYRKYMKKMEKIYNPQGMMIESQIGDWNKGEVHEYKIMEKNQNILSTVLGKYIYSLFYFCFQKVVSYIRKFLPTCLYNFR